MPERAAADAHRARDDARPELSLAQRELTPILLTKALRVDCSRTCVVREGESEAITRDRCSLVRCERALLVHRRRPLSLCKQARVRCGRGRPRLVRGERLTPELGGARLRAQKEERAGGAGDDRRRPRVCMEGGSEVLAAPFHGCSSGAGSRGAPVGAWSSSNQVTCRAPPRCNRFAPIASACRFDIARQSRSPTERRRRRLLFARSDRLIDVGGNDRGRAATAAGGRPRPYHARSHDV
jgi:hypothetical protein